MRMPGEAEGVGQYRNDGVSGRGSIGASEYRGIGVSENMMLRPTRNLVMALLLLVATHLGAQEAMKSPGLSYLLDDAVRIYVIDESQCSTKPDAKEGGRWYLIEGEETLDRLRKALSAVDVNKRGGCACGGPDIQFYAVKPDGTSRHFGLDCAVFLNGVQLPKELRGQLIPSSKEFIGRAGGMTYICDIPLGTTEEEARRAFSASDLILLTGGRWYMATDADPREVRLQEHRWNSAPVLLEFTLGPFSGPGCSDYASRREREGEWERKAGALVSEWIEKRLLGIHLLDRAGVSSSSSSSTQEWESAFFKEGLILDDAEAVRKALDIAPLPSLTMHERLRMEESTKRHQAPTLWLEESTFRTPQEQVVQGRYQAALLLWDTDPPERLDAARRLLGEGGTITFLCERKFVFD